MSTIPINLAVEDQLSEAVLRRILSHLDRGYAVGTAYNRGGYGYLKRTVRGWNSAAVGVPFVLLTDLDARYPCPRALIDDWLPVPQHRNLLFRVAIREVEAWLLSDRVNLAEFLGVPEVAVPRQAEILDDPKAALIDLARRSRSRDIRERIVPKLRSTARQGPDYNGCLSEFVSGHWDIEASCKECSSLLRAVHRLRVFTPAWQHD
jgi:hypothetical protein